MFDACLYEPTMAQLVIFVSSVSFESFSLFHQIVESLNLVFFLW